MMQRSLLVTATLVSISCLPALSRGAVCEPFRDYLRLATNGTPESASPQFMHQWRDRFRAELSRPDLPVDCRALFRRTLISLSNGVGDYQDSLTQAQSMVAEAQTPQQHVEAANHLVAARVLLNGRMMPPDAQDECVATATAALAHVPDGEALFGPTWIVDFDHVLTLRHVVATGRSAEADGMIPRLEALIALLDQTAAHPHATSQHRDSLLSTRCAVVKNIVSERMRRGESDAARAFIVQQQDIAQCSRAVMLLTLSSDARTSDAAKQASMQWIVENGVEPWDRAQALYNRAMRTFLIATPQNAPAAEVLESAIADFAEACRLASEPVPADDITAPMRADLAADAKYAQFALLRTIMNDKVRAAQAGIDFIAQFPENRHAHVVRSFLQIP